MGDLSELQAKVQRILAESWRVELVEGGGYFVRGESTGCYIDCFEGEKGKWNYVYLQSWVLMGVPITDEFLRYVASDDRMFGKLVITFSESGDMGDLRFNHTILGNYLDSDELNSAVMAVFYTADHLDDELQQRFGGQRAIDGRE